jgi:arylsulfatase A-like enzyme
MPRLMSSLRFPASVGPLKRISAALLLIGAVGALSCGDPTDTAAGRMPVVVILVDTLRADHLSPYGYPRETAPFLAELARESVVFENAFSTSSWTAPATASLFTSLYPEQHGVTSGRAMVRALVKRTSMKIPLNRISDEVATLPEVMKREGYESFCAADNLNISPEMGFARGFDEFRSDKPHNQGAEHVNSAILSWTEMLNRSESPFVYLHYFDPHEPYLSRAPWYQDEERDQLDEDSARYDSEIRHVDNQIQKLFEAFPWLNDSLVIFLSDHGEEFGDHGGMGHAKTLFNEVLRIPLFIRDPSGRFKPGRIQSNVSIIDVFPTLLELVGLQGDPRHEGRSLVKVMSTGEDEALEKRHLYAQLDRLLTKTDESKSEKGDGADDGEKVGASAVRKLTPIKDLAHSDAEVEQVSSRVVIRKNWKLFTDSRHSDRLFNFSNDPGERRDMIAEFPDLARDLRMNLKLFEQSMKRYKSRSYEEEINDETLDILRSLGYVQ